MMLVIGLSFAGSAEAAISFNNHPSDCKINVTVANYTTSEGAPTTNCWSATSITAKPGDTINVTLYYHNTGTTALNNAMVTLTNPGTGVLSGSVQMSMGLNGYITGNTVTVNLTKNSYLQYEELQQRDNTMSTHKTVSSSVNIFNGGLNVGTINPMQIVGGVSKYQGVFKAVFTVKDAGVVIDPNPTGAKPTAYTSTPTVNSSQGYATLKGSFTSGNLATTTCFQYRIVGNSSYTEVSCMNNGIADGDRNYQVTNLPTGNYEYRIIATNSVATANGNWVPFSINSGGVIIIDPEILSIVTNSATNVSNASSGNSNGYAVLNGNYSSNGSIRTCFEITGTRNGSTVYGPSTIDCQNRNGGYGNAAIGLNNLPAGYYEYRFTGYDNANNKTNGNYKTFTINENNNYQPPVIIYPQPPIYYPPVTGYGAPTVTTLPVFNFNNTEANLDGYVNGNGCATNTWFEYGNSAYSLSNRTNEIARGSGTGNAMQYISGLSPSTMYYYRLAARNCTGNVIYGQTQYFTTANTATRRIVQTSTVITRQSNNTTIVNGTGGNTKMVRLSIDNARTTMTRGEQVMYTVLWENVSNVVLNNLVLEVTMPKELKIMTTSRGDIDHSTNAVYLNIVRLDPQEEGQMFITANLNGNLQAGDPIVARAIMAFENSLLNGATDSAVEYDADNYIIGSNTGLAASIFGIGFLPSNLIGWLIIFLIIFLIVIAARHYVRTGRDGRDGRDGNDAMPYTPYRPTQ